MRYSPPCRWCGATAVARFAVLDNPRENPTTALTDRPRFSCSLHLLDQLAATDPGALVVLDPEFSRDQLPAMTDDSTRPMQPVRETVRRRPPAAAIQELNGADLLRALIVELERDEDAGGDPL